jgi:Na+-transporting NADH:ubiquinone oxidoreductase subunit C
LLLTAVASFTRPYQEANAEAEKIQNILNVLSVSYSEGASSQELVEIFEDKVRQDKLDGRDTYRYVPPADSDKTETVAIEFEGPGLWGPVKGFLALDRDMRTIRGITFYEHEETPGLGGEITSKGFREQFAGKSIVDRAGEPGIIISSSEGEAPNKVDAISGATLTCDKVQAMLNDVINKIVEEKQ